MVAAATTPPMPPTQTTHNRDRIRFMYSLIVKYARQNNLWFGLREQLDAHRQRQQLRFASSSSLTTPNIVPCHTASRRIRTPTKHPERSGRTPQALRVFQLFWQIGFLARTYARIYICKIRTGCANAPGIFCIVQRWMLLGGVGCFFLGWRSNGVDGDVCNRDWRMYFFGLGHNVTAITHHPPENNPSTLMTAIVRVYYPTCSYRFFLMCGIRVNVCWYSWTIAPDTGHGKRETLSTVCRLLRAAVWREWRGMCAGPSEGCRDSRKFAPVRCRLTGWQTNSLAG